MSGGKKSGEIPTRILLTQEVKLKQERLVANCDEEVMWVGLVDTVEAGNYNYLRVYDVLVPKQEVTASSVDWEGSMNDLLLEMVQNGRGDEIENMKYFGHSHVNMSVFHSTTDMKQVWSYAEIAELDWFLSAVYNKDKEHTIRLDMFRPFRMHVNECELIELSPPAINAWAKEQLEKNVKEKPRVVQATTYSYQSPMPNFAISYDRAKKMYTDGEQVSIHVTSGTRYLVVDGEIVGAEETKTGELVWMDDDAEDRFSKTEKQVTTQPTVSRSIQRSEEKRAEGNSEGESTDGHSPTPTASEAERRQLDEQQRKPLALLPPVSRTTEVILEEVVDSLELKERAHVLDDDDDELLRWYEEMGGSPAAAWFAHGYY